jgi:hypothetical protein
MAAHKIFNSGDDAFPNQFIGPLAVDNQIRQAVQICWMTLPKNQRNVDKLKSEIRRIMDRVFRDLDEDNDFISEL